MGSMRPTLPPDRRSAFEDAAAGKHSVDTHRWSIMGRRAWGGLVGRVSWRAARVGRFGVSQSLGSRENGQDAMASFFAQPA